MRAHTKLKHSSIPVYSNNNYNDDDDDDDSNNRGTF